jgi:hypothetical protein
MKYNADKLLECPQDNASVEVKPENGEVLFESLPRNESIIASQGEKENKITADEIKKQLLNESEWEQSLAGLSHIKPRNIEEVRKEVATFKAKDGYGREIGVDGKIVDLVVGLCRWGVETNDSDEGHLIIRKMGQLPFPYVSFLKKNESLVELLLNAYNREDDTNDKWEITDKFEKDSLVLLPKLRDYKVIKPSSLFSIRELRIFWDSLQKHKQQLHRSQETARKFGEWLENLPDDYDFYATKK